MSKKLTVILLTSLSGIAGSFAAGDEYVCANADEKQRLIDAGLAAENTKAASDAAGSVSIKLDVVAAAEKAKVEAEAEQQADLLDDNPETGA